MTEDDARTAYTVGFDLGLAGTDQATLRDGLSGKALLYAKAGWADGEWQRKSGEPSFEFDPDDFNEEEDA